MKVRHGGWAGRVRQLEEGVREERIVSGTTGRGKGRAVADYLLWGRGVLLFSTQRKENP